MRMQEFTSVFVVLLWGVLRDGLWFVFFKMQYQSRMADVSFVRSVVRRFLRLSHALRKSVSARGCHEPG